MVTREVFFLEINGLIMGFVIKENVNLSATITGKGKFEIGNTVALSPVEDRFTQR